MNTCIPTQKLILDPLEASKSSKQFIFIRFQTNRNSTFIFNNMKFSTSIIIFLLSSLHSWMVKLDSNSPMSRGKLGSTSPISSCFPHLQKSSQQLQQHQQQHQNAPFNNRKHLQQLNGSKSLSFSLLSQEP